MLKMVMLPPREPYKYTEPQPPKEFVEEEHNITLEFGITYTVDDMLSRADVLYQEPLKIKASDLRFRIREHDNGSECYTYTQIYYVVTKPNKKYDTQLKAYEKSMAAYLQKLPEWENEMKQYLEDIKEYLAWAKQEKKNIDRSYYTNILKQYSYIK